MAVYKDKNRGTWYASVLYVDWTGKRCRKLKRGFATKKSLKPHGLSDFFFKDFWMSYNYFMFFPFLL